MAAALTLLKHQVLDEFLVCCAMLALAEALRRVSTGTLLPKLFISLQPRVLEDSVVEGDMTRTYVLVGAFDAHSWALDFRMLCIYRGCQVGVKLIEHCSETDLRY